MNDCDQCATLTETVIAQDREIRHLRTAVRDLQAERGEEHNASYVVVLLGRIATLEQNILKLTERREATAA